MSPRDASPQGASSGMSSWAAHALLAIGALIMLAPFYFMFVFATHSRTEIMSVPPQLLPGDDLLTNLGILTERISFWRLPRSRCEVRLDP